MGQSTYLTPEEMEAFRLSLEQGKAEKVFIDLAVYLERNALKLSDDVLRLYVEKELFDCFTNRSDAFRAVLTP